jgi:histidine triad (HIT) family protein
MAGKSAGAPDCEFCKIVDGVAQANVVFESESVLAFLPLKPASAGHMLVIPKRHVSDLWQLDMPIDVPLLDVVVLLGRAAKVALSPDGMNLISSAGEAASQTVFHLHMHVVPRWENDSIGSIWPPGQPWTGAMLEGTAELIRDAVDAIRNDV